jgi:hypothetical protein
MESLQEHASVNPSTGEGEMARREEMFVRYSDSVETLQAGEAETVDQIAATLLNIAKKVGERQRHTLRGVHAKSHGQGHRCGGRDASEPRRPGDPGFHFR